MVPFIRRMIKKKFILNYDIAWVRTTHFIVFFSFHWFSHSTKLFRVDGSDNVCPSADFYAFNCGSISLAHSISLIHFISVTFSGRSVKNHSKMKHTHTFVYTFRWAFHSINPQTIFGWRCFYGFAYQNWLSNRNNHLKW